MKAPFSGTRLLNDPAIKTTVLAGLEKQFNAALALDPVTVIQLSEMAGVVVEVQCSEPEFQCYVFLEKEGVRLAGYHEGETDAGIRGSIVALADLVAKRDQAIDAVPGLESWGSTDVLNRLSAIHQSVEFDWETVLCRCFGDVGGHLLAKGFHFASSQAEKIKTAAADNLEGYLQEELRLLPSRNELAAFAADVAELKLAVDGLADTVNDLNKQP